MNPQAVLELPVDSIVCAPQVREHFDEEELAGLAQSLREVGLQQPIRVRPDGDGWVVIDGERRLRACRMIGSASISAIVDAGELSQAQLIQRQLIANVQRSDLRPVERARAIQNLMREAKLSAAHAAAKLGLSPASVSKLLALLLLPADAQQRVNAGELGASTAYSVVKIRNADERAQLLEEAKHGRLTRDKVTSRSRTRTPAGTQSSSQSPARVPRERVVLALGGARSVTIAGPALTVPALIEWTEELLGRLRPLGATAASLNELAHALRAHEPSGGAR